MQLTTGNKLIFSFAVLLGAIVIAAVIWSLPDAAVPAVESEPVAAAPGEPVPSEPAAAPAEPVDDTWRYGRASDRPGGPDQWIASDATRAALASAEGEVLYYGRVIDQDDQPVPYAVAHMGLYSWETGAHDVDVTADADGRFVLRWPRASSASVYLLSREGYVSPPTRDYTTWGERFGQKQTRRPDPNNPIIYRLWKQKEPLQPLLRCVMDRDLTSMNEFGESVLVRLKAAGEPSDVWYRLDRTREGSSGPIGWTFTVGVHQGGVQLIDKGRPNWEAPADGYAQSIQWKANIEDPGAWRGVEETLFLRMRDGPYYARVNVRLRPGNSGLTEPVANIRIDGVYGLHGRRWLELLEGPDGNLLDTLDAARRYVPKEPTKPTSPPQTPGQREVPPRDGAKSVKIPVGEVRPPPGPVTHDIHFAVVDQDEKPVPGVALSIYSGGSLSHDAPMPTEHVLRGLTDAQGESVIRGVTANYPKLLTADKTGYVLEPFVVPEVPFARYPQLSDRVTAGKPVRSALVRLWRIDDAKPVPVVRILRFIMPHPDNEPYKLNLMDPSVERYQQGRLYGLPRNRDGTLSSVPKALTDDQIAAETFVHDLRLFLRVIPQQQYDPKPHPIAVCRIEAVDGGVIATTDPFMFEAPLDGYQASSEWTVQSTKESRDQMHRFFVRSREGKIYAAFQIRTENLTGANPTFRIHYWYNPNGDRNLLPGRSYDSFEAYQAAEEGKP